MFRMREEIEMPELCRFLGIVIYMLLLEDWNLAEKHQPLN
jgi:hypothetical protein